MLPKEKLRKADVITGGLITLLGLWIIGKALEMPMKESYGGVQNVWYVSPALFPLIVGSALTLLGLLLTGIAVKTLGTAQVRQLVKELVAFVVAKPRLSLPTARFFSIVGCFFFFIFMNVPRVDFVICSMLFLFIFIQSFYLSEERFLIKLSLVYFSGSLLFAAYFGFGLAKVLQPSFTYLTDGLNLLFLLILILYTYRLCYQELALLKRFKIGLIVSLAVPLVVGPVFKFRLLIPLPYEGLTAQFMDFLVYDVFFP